ncbi:MAG: hypothetical protein IJT73_06220 [Selenomonadaceae bacterium]|nr:hypothetical protein [Selenomonadaceae bacterium]
MNKIKNQRGFAVLEIILIVGVIAIFSSVALPKMKITLDKVALNYEMKHLYSELNLVRSIGKSSTFNGGIFPTMQDAGHKVEIWLYSKNYSNESARNRYQIMRTSLTSTPYYRHNLTNGINLEFSGGYYLKEIDFSNLGDSQKFTLISKFGDKAYVKIDSLGRVRGTYNEE